MQILVTGGLGWTARPIVLSLIAAGHEVIAFDLPEVEKPHEYVGERVAVVRGDVRELAMLERVASLCEVIVHLAVAIGEDDYDDGAIPFATNVLGTYNVFRAARDRGVERVVVMSSAPVHIALESSVHVSPEARLPTSAGDDHLYDLTKVLQESVARDFAATFGVNTVVVRAGHVVDGKLGVDMRYQPLAELDYCKGGWVCRHDLAKVVCAAVEADLGGFQVFYAVGAHPGRARFDVSRTESLLDLTLDEDFTGEPEVEPEPSVIVTED